MAAATEPMLETELWGSFVSLLRSYVAAANLNLDQHARIEGAGNSIAIVASESHLTMEFNPQTSEVSCRPRCGSSASISSTFEFLPEGTIHIDGAVKDLDQVAIDLVASAMHRGKGTQR